MAEVGPGGAGGGPTGARVLEAWRAARVAASLLLVGAALRLWKLRRVRVLLERLAPRPWRDVRAGSSFEAATGSGVRPGGRRSPGSRRVPGRREEAERLAALVMRTNRRLLPWEARCLTESLTLWWLLRRRRIDARLCIGVRTLLGPLESHAWVEHEGVPLNDTPDVARVYEPLDSLDPGPDPLSTT